MSHQLLPQVLQASTLFPYWVRKKNNAELPVSPVHFPEINPIAEAIQPPPASSWLLNNLEKWAKTKNDGEIIERKVVEKIENKQTVYVAQLLEEHKANSREFHVYPSRHRVEARGVNCTKAVYNEMLNVLIGSSIENIEIDAAAPAQKSARLLNVSFTNLSADRIAKVFESIIDKRCVPFLISRRGGDFKQVVSYLSVGYADKMAALAVQLNEQEKLRYDQQYQAEFDELQDLAYRAAFLSDI